AAYIARRSPRLDARDLQQIRQAVLGFVSSGQRVGLREFVGRAQRVGDGHRRLVESGAGVFVAVWPDQSNLEAHPVGASSSRSPGSLRGVGREEGLQSHCGELLLGSVERGIVELWI